MSVRVAVTGLCLSLASLAACSGSAGSSGDASGAGGHTSGAGGLEGGAAGSTSPTPDAGAGTGGASAGTGGASPDAAIAAAGAAGMTPAIPLTAADLQGGWVAVGLVADLGTTNLTHMRLRFDGDKYFLAYSSDYLYCVEVGAFEATTAGIHFHDGKVSSNADGCAAPQDRAGSARASAAGMDLDLAGVVTSFARIRNVPKVFATVEKHDGDFADDATLSGANAIAKADAFCDASLMKPDNGHYRAMVWDGVNRPAPPAAAAVLQPRTTYFQADGVRNVLTTNVLGLPRYLQTIIPDFDDILYSWSQQGCAGWTSKTAGDSRLVDASQPTLISVSGLCSDSFSVLCVGDGEPIGGGLTAARPPTRAPRPTRAPARTSSRSRAPGAPATRPPTRVPRPRPSGSTSRARGTASFTTTRDSTAARRARSTVTGSRIRFVPRLEDGSGYCRIGDIREAELGVDASTLTLSFATGKASYVRAAAVPKIFVSFETHDGDFLDDPVLTGATAIAKADSLCNGSSAKPDGQAYKAMLLDGANRNVSPAVDWPLKPATMYFQAAGKLPVFVTDAQGHVTPSVPDLNPLLSGVGGIDYEWSGLDYYGLTILEGHLRRLDVRERQVGRGPRRHPGRRPRRAFGVLQRRVPPHLREPVGSASPGRGSGDASHGSSAGVPASAARISPTKASLFARALSRGTIKTAPRGSSSHAASSPARGASASAPSRPATAPARSPSARSTRAASRASASSPRLGRG